MWSQRLLSDVSHTEAAKQLVSASRQWMLITQGSGVDPMDQPSYANQRQRIVSSTHPDKQFNDVRTCSGNRRPMPEKPRLFEVPANGRPATRYSQAEDRFRGAAHLPFTGSLATRLCCGQAENVAKPIP